MMDSVSIIMLKPVAIYHRHLPTLSTMQHLNSLEFDLVLSYLDRLVVYKAPAVETCDLPTLYISISLDLVRSRISSLVQYYKTTTIADEPIFKLRMIMDA